MADRSGYHPRCLFRDGLCFAARPLEASRDEPGLAVLPMVTRTGSGIPADAPQCGLVGSKEISSALCKPPGGFRPTQFTPAHERVEIIGSVVLDRPDQDAPVSPLYYQGKKRTVAFEKPDGRSAGQAPSTFAFC